MGSFLTGMIGALGEQAQQRQVKQTAQNVRRQNLMGDFLKTLATAPGADPQMAEQYMMKYGELMQLPPEKVGKYIKDFDPTAPMDQYYKQKAAAKQKHAAMGKAKQALHTMREKVPAAFQGMVGAETQDQQLPFTQPPPPPGMDYGAVDPRRLGDEAARRSRMSAGAAAEASARQYDLRDARKRAIEDSQWKNSPQIVHGGALPEDAVDIYGRPRQVGAQYQEQYRGNEKRWKMIKPPPPPGSEEESSFTEQKDADIQALYGAEVLGRLPETPAEQARARLWGAQQGRPEKAPPKPTAGELARAAEMELNEKAQVFLDAAPNAETAYFDAKNAQAPYAVRQKILNIDSVEKRVLPEVLRKYGQEVADEVERLVNKHGGAIAALKALRESTHSSVPTDIRKGLQLLAREEGKKSKFGVVEILREK